MIWVVAQHLLEGVFEKSGGRLPTSQRSDGAKAESDDDRSDAAHGTILAQIPPHPLLVSWPDGDRVRETAYPEEFLPVSEHRGPTRAYNAAIGTCSTTGIFNCDS